MNLTTEHVILARTIYCDYILETIYICAVFSITGSTENNNMPNMKLQMLL